MNIRKHAFRLTLCLLVILSIAISYLKGKADGYKVKLIDHGMESYICLMVENKPDRKGEGLDLIEQNLYRAIYLSEELDRLSFLSVAALAMMDYNSMKEHYFNMVRRYYHKYPEGYHRLFDPHSQEASMASILESAADNLDDDVRGIYTQLTQNAEQTFDSLSSNIDEQILKDKTVIDRILGIEGDGTQQSP